MPTSAVLTDKEITSEGLPYKPSGVYSEGPVCDLAPQPKLVIPVVPVFPAVCMEGQFIVLDVVRAVGASHVPINLGMRATVVGAPESDLIIFEEHW